MVSTPPSAPAPPPERALTMAATTDGPLQLPVAAAGGAAPGVHERLRAPLLPGHDGPQQEWGDGHLLEVRARGGAAESVHFDMLRAHGGGCSPSTSSIHLALAIPRSLTSLNGLAACLPARLNKADRKQGSIILN